VKKFQFIYTNLAIVKALILSAAVVFIYKYLIPHSSGVETLFNYYFLGWLLLIIAVLWLVFSTRTITINNAKICVFNPLLKRFSIQKIEIDNINYYYWQYGIYQSPTLTIVPKNAEKKMKIQVLSSSAVDKINSFFLEIGIRQSTQE